jgi:hypothetical protein
VFDGVAALVAEGTATDNAAAEAEPSPQLALFEASRRTPLGSTSDAANEDVPVAGFLDDEKPQPKRRFAWAFGALLAFVALAAQAALYFRTEIVVLLPETRTYLAAACVKLKCDLRLPRRPKLMAIESSDLQADGRRENVIVLNAVLRNQAQFAQEYPALELTLTDEHDEAVARRVLLPANYLASVTKEQIAHGIGAGADVALRVFIDTSGLRAVGYRMYLFFP